MPVRYCLIAVVLLALAGCATAPSQPTLVHMPSDAVAGRVATLPAGSHISTGQPDAAALKAVADAGYVGVIDLRTAGEDRGFDEEGVTRQLGMRYVSIPVGGPADMTYANAALLDRALAKLDGPVLLHCASGNRVGALMALRASAAGASDDEALAAGREAGLTRSDDAIVRRLEEN